MKKLLLFTFAIINILNLFSQDNEYWISFKDKSATSFSIEEPELFMHPLALARREKHKVPIHFTDLPIPISYLQSIEALNVSIIGTSKWLNGAKVILPNEAVKQSIEALAFVKAVHLIKSSDVNTKSNSKFNVLETPINVNKNNEFDYATSFRQIEMLSGNLLHNIGYTGSDIDIAIMDNGFPKVNTNSFYQTAYNEGRIIAGYDFVLNEDTIFDNKNGDHGNYVISTMVSFKDGTFIGTAPKATYYLFSTEDNVNEGLAEEYNWALAAEMADTLLGVNAILSTSLGYSSGFDDATTSHTFTDMDGNTTPITIAADLAASKGFLVINSAGNEGGNSWKYITAPSDGDSVLCIGAVKADETIAAFSSRGPSADGRIKPNVCAQGAQVVGVNTGGNLVNISGTSFSCPITSGMAACLWQAFPEKTNMEIFYAIEKSAHLYNNPNNDFGYGIPNFHFAYLQLLDQNLAKDKLVIFPNPIDDVIRFWFESDDLTNTFKVKIFSIEGKKYYEHKMDKSASFYDLKDLSFLQKGIYVFQIEYGKQKIQTKIVKN